LLCARIDDFDNVAGVRVGLGPGVALHILGVDFRLRWGEEGAEDHLRVGRIQIGFVGGVEPKTKNRNRGRKMKENYEKEGKSEKEN
jgi:hypothetical protein